MAKISKILHTLWRGLSPLHLGLVLLEVGPFCRIVVSMCYDASRSHSLLQPFPPELVHLVQTSDPWHPFDLRLDMMWKTHRMVIPTTYSNGV